MAYSEDILHEVYEEVQNNGMREDFDTQINKMGHQEKHKYKTVCEKWEYALYRIKGGKSLDKY
jgi:hypothetical protein